jgi:hypothetical protein
MSVKPVALIIATPSRRGPAVVNSSVTDSEPNPDMNKLASPL